MQIARRTQHEMIEQKNHFLFRAFTLIVNIIYEPPRLKHLIEEKRRQNRPKQNGSQLLECGVGCGRLHRQSATPHPTPRRLTLDSTFNSSCETRPHTTPDPILHTRIETLLHSTPAGGHFVVSRKTKNSHQNEKKTFTNRSAPIANGIVTIISYANINGA